MEAHVVTRAVITCPLCGVASRETMPTDACQVFYRCRSCDAAVTRRQGDCCVFCSYADVACPPWQSDSI